MAATKNPGARLEHVLFHIRGVEDTIAGISYNTFRSVYYMERTVERAVAIVSEAVKALRSNCWTSIPTRNGKRS
jgi:uncharacterized protein with HEPN domain